MIAIVGIDSYTLCPDGRRTSMDSWQPQTNRKVMCNTEGAGVVCASHITVIAVLIIKGGSRGTASDK